MTGRRSSFRRPGGLVLLSLLACPLLTHAAGKKPRRTDGPYNVTAGGSYAGRGVAVVAGRAVLITVRVTDEAGAQGLLVATDLRIDGGHFRGAGLALGRPATITGRLDGYAGDKEFRGARLLCSFADASGRTGRVAGVLR